MKYIALLRGINVGGKNKVSMKELKKVFEELEFTEVSTYLNSGNVLFESEKKDIPALIALCEEAIEKHFGFFVRTCIISVPNLQKALEHAPDWWGKNSEDKNNAIIVIPPAKTSDVMQSVGEAKPEYEKVDSYGQVIFWWAPLKTFSRTRWSKIVGTQAYKDITIRNANTIRKLCAMA